LPVAALSAVASGAVLAVSRERLKDVEGTSFSRLEESSQERRLRSALWRGWLGAAVSLGQCAVLLPLAVWVTHARPSRPAPSACRRPACCSSSPLRLSPPVALADLRRAYAARKAWRDERDAVGPV